MFPRTVEGDEAPATTEDEEAAPVEEPTPTPIDEKASQARAE